MLLLSLIGLSYGVVFTQDGGIKNLHSQAKNSILWRNSSKGSFFDREQVSFSGFRCFSDANDTSPNLDRKFLAQLWVSDQKKLKAMEKRDKKAPKNRNDRENGFENDYEPAKPTLQQPPVSQSMSGLLKPKTSEEVTRLLSFLWLLNYSLIKMLSFLVLA